MVHRVMCRWCVCFASNIDVSIILLWLFSFTNLKFGACTEHTQLCFVVSCDYQCFMYSTITFTQKQRAPRTTSPHNHSIMFSLTGYIRTSQGTLAKQNENGNFRSTPNNCSFVCKSQRKDILNLISLEADSLCSRLVRLHILFICR